MSRDQGARRATPDRTGGGAAPRCPVRYRARDQRTQRRSARLRSPGAQRSTDGDLRLADRPACQALTQPRSRQGQSTTRAAPMAGVYPLSRRLQNLYITEQRLNGPCASSPSVGRPGCSADRIAAIALSSSALIGTAKLSMSIRKPALPMCLHALQSSPPTPRRVAAVELAQARRNRSLTMHINKIHSVRSIARVARELGEK